MCFVTAACGQSTGPIAFDSIPPSTVPAATKPQATIPGTSASTTTTIPATTTTVGLTGNWTNASQGLVGLESECGNLSMMSVRADRDMLIASVSLQGLWSSVGSDTWTRLGTGKNSAGIINRGSAILYDPAHPNTFWESGIYNGGGVYRTDDNGATFRQLGNISLTEALSIDFSDPERKTMISTTHEVTRIARSTDAGSTWTDISAALPAGVGFTTGPLVINPTTYILGTSNTATSGIFRTTDSGATWTPVSKAPTLGKPLVASDGSIYFVLQKGIARSTDQGVTWTIMTDQSIVSPAATVLIELPDGRLATVGNNILVVSGDHGATWQSLGPALPVSPNGLVYSKFRKAFYVWHHDCDFTTKDPIQANTIMRLDYDATKR